MDLTPSNAAKLRALSSTSFTTSVAISPAIPADLTTKSIDFLATECEKILKRVRRK